MPRLLLVDDDEPLRALLRRLLADIGGGRIDVTEAGSVEAARAALDRDKFDVILCDLRLGAGSGVDVLAEATTRDRSTRRILMSSFADPVVVRHAFERAQIDAYIEKPMTMTEFERELAHHLAEHLPPRAPA